MAHSRLETRVVTAAAANPPRSRLREAWINIRNRLIGNPRFQRFAAKFPLTRPVARRRAEAVFDLSAGFVYTQILYAVVRLDLLAALRAGPVPLDDLAQSVGLTREPLSRLLTAAAALELVERLPSGRVALGSVGAALLAQPGALAMIAHHDRLYGDLADPVALLRGTRTTQLGRLWPYAAADSPREIDEAETRDYSALMDASQDFVSGELLAVYDFSRHRHLLDIGGGEAAFALRAARRHTNLRCTSFDLPGVAMRARERVATAGLESRVSIAAGDFFRDPLPEGADAVTLLRILHDHDDGPALALLRAVRRIMPPNGRLLIAEPMSNGKGGRRIADAYFGMYLLAMGSGRPRSVDETARLLKLAGFRSRALHAPGAWMSSILVARPSETMPSDDHVSVFIDNK